MLLNTVNECEQIWPTVYWLKLEEQNLYNNFLIWEKWLKAIRPDLRRVSDDLHCMLLYDQNNVHEAYNTAWEENLEGKHSLLTTGDLIIGPQGAAVEAILDEAMMQWYKVTNAIPHVSLMITTDREPKDLGSMMKASKEINWIKTDNENIYRSLDGTYFKVTMRAVDRAVAERVIVNRSRPVTQYVLTSAQEELLQQVPNQLWTQHHTDVGLVKSAGAVQIIVKPNVQLPYDRQYPLSIAAYEGIKPTTEGLVQAGVLVETKSQSNMPIFPVWKLNSAKWRLVHDLRAINAIVEAETPIVPDPYTLLSSIPSDAKYYLVIDLCSAFLSIPLHEQSRHLFAFTYGGKQYTYTRMLQGMLLYDLL
ncbi:hypothetical protein AOLI_G00147770 [Acnodon oligacanthus]